VVTFATVVAVLAVAETAPKLRFAEPLPSQPEKPVAPDVADTPQPSHRQPGAVASRHVPSGNLYARPVAPAFEVMLGDVFSPPESLTPSARVAVSASPVL
jgi:hypothetical protein